ncbi:unnamed protein product, partial [Heterosigma akashiwo]
MLRVYYLLLWLTLGCSLTCSFIQSSLLSAQNPAAYHQRVEKNGIVNRRCRRASQTTMVSEEEDREAVYTVVFVRHGQSTWNKANRFIGWTDTELTPEGELEARIAGSLLAEADYQFDEVHTSMLKRAIKTSWLVLEQLGTEYTPVVCDYRLNERSYGTLVGLYKKECVEEFGAPQVKQWRRSYDVPPPPMDETSQYWPGHDPRYAHLPRECIPLSESLKDTSKRSLSYWNEELVPRIRAGKQLLVSGHENNLRSLLMHLDQVSPEVIVNVEVPRAVPLVYYLDKDLRPIKLAGAAPHLSGRYLGDPEELRRIMERDSKQVYDLSVRENLETEENAFNRLALVEGQTALPPDP